MDNSSALEFCAWNAVWQIARRSTAIVNTITSPFFSDLVTLLEKCREQDSQLQESIQTLQNDEVFTVDADKIICAAEICTDFFGRLQQEDTFNVGSENDARDVFVSTLEIFSKPDNSLCNGKMMIRIPNEGGIMEEFNSISLLYPDTNGSSTMQQALENWLTPKGENDTIQISRKILSAPEILLITLETPYIFNENQKSTIAYEDVGEVYLKFLQQDLTKGFGLSTKVIRYRIVGMLKYGDSHWIAVLPYILLHFQFSKS